MRRITVFMTLAACIALLLCAEASAVENVAEILSKGNPKQYFATTKDGWTLALYRYKPENIKEGTDPVILCHGFNMNSNFWDLDAEHSFARYLRDKGYDIWSVNLRGSGDSSKPFMADLRSFSKLQVVKWPRMIVTMPLDLDKFKWSFDDHANKDIPAIINFVKKRTGKDKVVWFGHSMGGMIMYAYLTTHDQSDIRAFAAMGSTMYVEERPGEESAFYEILKRRDLRNTALIVNMTIASQIMNLSLGTIQFKWEKALYNVENMDRLEAIRMFRLCINDTSPGVVDAYANLLDTGELKSADGKFSYTKNLDRVKVPVLITVASMDPFGPMNISRYVLDHISSQDKEIVEFSKAAGYSADYGHCDVILGRRSREEVFPRLYEWLEKR